MPKAKKNIPPLFTIKGEYEAECVDVYDGDTITVAFDPLPDSKYSGLYSFKIRVMGIDTPEKKIPKKNPNRDRLKQMGIVAQEYLSSLVLGKTVKLRIIGNDLYGRSLAYISVDDKEINDMMVTGGYAVPYLGETKIDWSKVPTYPLPPGTNIEDFYPDALPAPDTTEPLPDTRGKKTRGRRPRGSSRK